MTKSEVAYEKIKQGILTGMIEKDRPLSEIHLVEFLGISRTPIRAALQRLQLEGFVKIIPNQGVIVSEISLKEATELYELRQVVEGYLLRQTVGQLNEKDFTILEQYIADQEKALADKDFHRYLALDADMHLHCYRSHQNDAMKTILRNYQERLYHVRYLTCAKRGSRIAEHRLFIEALRGHDVDRACAVMCEHINKGVMAHIV